MSQPWFAVDKAGLGKLLERKGKPFILYELVQNAWDENTKRVDIKLIRGTNNETYLEVRDDNPTGFSNLAYAFTLFAESEKKSHAEKRGRFNLGEKLVLAVCDEATIASTKGTVIFNAEGRTNSAQCTQTGSVFSAKLKLTAKELADFDEAARRLIPPPGIATYYNGDLLEDRPVIKKLDGITLPTELGDDNGVLRPTTRKTVVELVNPLPDEDAMIYEMGIPVVEIDGRWHVNVGQKVPLNMDRDNVTPAYLGQIRAIIAEQMVDQLTQEDANSAWVRDAIARHGDNMDADTINQLLELRYGNKRVAYDPQDPEANARAVAAGYVVVHGGSMSKAEWAAAKRVGAIKPAGLVTPSPKAFEEGGQHLKLQPEEKLTPGMVWFRDYTIRIGKTLLGFEPKFRYANDPGWPAFACYGRREITFNIARLGYKWFDGEFAKLNDLIIHEFGHEFSGNHLDDAYHDALCALGGKLSQLALEQPKLFDR